MKTRFLILIVLLPVMISFNDSIPGKVKNSFMDKFKGVESVDWATNEKGNYVAYFITNNTEVEAAFSKDGKWLNTYTTLSMEEVPDCINNYINKNYSDTYLNNVKGYEDPDTEKAYHLFVSIDNFDALDEDYINDTEYNDTNTSYSDLKLIFDIDCNFIKEEAVIY
ncbi:MAG TPA: PepSY-like domain-containing protein [Cyclobacteriaceae bacterium]